MARAATEPPQHRVPRRRAGRAGKTIRFTGVNVQVVNGLEATETLNGVGNLIVGYNEGRPEGGDIRTGSHNLVGGIFSNYGSAGGLVVGDGNSILAPHATVTGGGGNSATGVNSAVGGGYLNAATSYLSSVVGGGNNRADFEYSTIIGGNANRTLGGSAVVVGGELNVASASLATAVGGELNLASGYGSTVGDGGSRTATGTDNWAAGGLFQSQ